jgi:hypothetical protein
VNEDAPCTITIGGVVGAGTCAAVTGECIPHPIPMP